MLGILKVKMSLEYPTFETAFESGLLVPHSASVASFAFALDQLEGGGMLRNQHILLPKGLVGLVGACTHPTHRSAWLGHMHPRAS